MLSRIWPLLRSLFFAALFISLQMYFLPRWLGLHGSLDAPRGQPLRWLGLLPLTLGALIMIWCVLGFGLLGQGTPAPFDAPRRLVSRGLYKHVRNPMYWGMALALFGEALLIAEFRWSLLIYAAALIAIVYAFVLLYEEPALKRRFGDEYEEYKSEVPRWIPRLRRAQPSRRVSASSRP